MTLQPYSIDKIGDGIIQGFPERKSKSHRYDSKDIIDIILAIITVLTTIFSAIIIFFTLREMQIERDSAYMPDIFFKDCKLVIALDDEGNLVNVGEAGVWSHYKETMDFYNTSPNILFENIGMGTAKYLRVQWDTANNMQKLTDYMYSINDDGFFTYNINEKTHNLSIKVRSSEINKSSRSITEIAFIKNESENQITPFPYEYFLCLQNICHYYQGGGLFIPNIDVITTYQDIQGKEYNKTKTFQIKLEALEINEVNSWYAFLIREIISK